MQTTQTTFPLKDMVSVNTTVYVFMLFSFSFLVSLGETQLAHTVIHKICTNYTDIAATSFLNSRWSNNQNPFRLSINLNWYIQIIEI